MASLPRALLTLVLALGGLHCAPRPAQLRVPLEYTANDGLADSLKALSIAPGRKLYVALAPSTEPGHAIGENAEKEAVVPVYGVNGSPEGFVATAIERELARLGVAVVSSEDAADRTLKMRVTRFFVRETGTYEAEVITQAEVQGKDGASLWSGAAAGTAKRFGRSLSAENYREALSSATSDMLAHLLSNPDAQKALFAR